MRKTSLKIQMLAGNSLNSCLDSRSQEKSPLMTDRVSETGFLEVQISWRNGFIEDFSSFFCQIFGIFYDFSKWIASKALRKFEKASNMEKNDEKFNLPLAHFSGMYPIRH